jgi:hypothetical protein
MSSLILLLLITINGVSIEIERPVQDDLALLELPQDVISVLNSEPCEVAGPLLADHLRNRYTHTGGIPLEISWRCDVPETEKPAAALTPKVLTPREVRLPDDFEPAGPPKPARLQ